MNWMPKAADSSRLHTSVGEVEIDCAGATDVGLNRKRNEDHFLIADLHKNMHVSDSSVPFPSPELFGQPMGKLLVVADGIGGGNAGDFASQLAIQEMSIHLLNSMHWLFCPRQPEIEQFVEDLKTGAFRTHRAVCRDSANNPQHHGMGCTLTVAYLIWPMLYVLHVGDSRCYVLRDGYIQCLTKDQTLAQMLYDSGHLNEVEFVESPYHHVLVSAIGGSNDPEAVVYKTRLLAGDRILLCSDGVNAHLTDGQIETILAKPKAPNEICQELIDESNLAGGTDNITAIVASSTQTRKF